MAAQFEIVRDQGGNIGLLCPVCNQARWVENHGVGDWSTGQDCPNCIEMKANNDFNNEKAKDDLEKIKAEKATLEAKALEESNKIQTSISLKDQAIKTVEGKIKKDEGSIEPKTNPN